MPEKTQKWVKHVQPLGGMRIRERDIQSDGQSSTVQLGSIHIDKHIL